MAIVALQAWDRADVGVVLPQLRRRLNPPGFQPVDITVAWDVLSFTAATWLPILRVRVEDAMEATVGWAWRERFEWAS